MRHESLSAPLAATAEHGAHRSGVSSEGRGLPGCMARGARHTSSSICGSCGQSTSASCESPPSLTSASVSAGSASINLPLPRYAALTPGRASSNGGVSRSGYARVLSKRALDASDASYGVSLPSEMATASSSVVLGLRPCASPTRYETSGAFVRSPLSCAAARASSRSSSTSAGESERSPASRMPRSSRRRVSSSQSSTLRSYVEEQRREESLGLLLFATIAA